MSLLIKTQNGRGADCVLPINFSQCRNSGSERIPYVQGWAGPRGVMAVPPAGEILFGIPEGVSFSALPSEAIPDGIINCRGLVAR